eukprot:4426879-Prymnesium_polylepis.4
MQGISYAASRRGKLITLATTDSGCDLVPVLAFVPHCRDPHTTSGQRTLRGAYRMRVVGDLVALGRIYGGGRGLRRVVSRRRVCPADPTKVEVKRVRIWTVQRDQLCDG